MIGTIRGCDLFEMSTLGKGREITDREVCIYPGKEELSNLYPGTGNDITQILQVNLINPIYHLSTYSLYTCSDTLKSIPVKL